jgi:hypothetical protein
MVHGGAVGFYFLFYYESDSERIRRDAAPSGYICRVLKARGLSSINKNIIA